jgi:cytoskeletal protein RodZ
MEREKHTLSIKDISDRTKVGLRYLVALEEDRWEEMPQKFFIRSIIKAHAQAVGVDPEPFLARYEEQEKARLESPENEGVSPQRRKRDAQAGRTRRILVPALAALLVLGAAAAGYLLFLKPGEKPAPPVS